MMEAGWRLLVLLLVAADLISGYHRNLIADLACTRILCVKGYMLDCQCRQKAYSSFDRRSIQLRRCRWIDFVNKLSEVMDELDSADAALCEKYSGKASSIPAGLEVHLPSKHKDSHHTMVRRDAIKIAFEEGPPPKDKKFFDDEFLSVVHKSDERRGLEPPHPGDHREGPKKRSLWTGRQKRSNPLGMLTTVPSPRRVAWTFTSPYNSPPSSMLTVQSQKDQIRLALAMYERLSNLCFVEEPTNTAVVQFSFEARYHGTHTSFSPSILAHTMPKQYVHLNKEDWRWELDESSSLGYPNSAIMRTVLQHEIAHLVGMGHSSTSNITRSDYEYGKDPPELGAGDLRQLTQLYGKCVGSYDVIFDLLYTQPSKPGYLMFRTLMIRNDLIWQYEHRLGMPSPGYPIRISYEIPGVFGYPRGMFQVYSWSLANLHDPYVYIIQGSSYQKFQTSGSGMEYVASGRITDFGLPPYTMIDSAMYDYGTGMIYMFHSSSVYVVRPIINTVTRTVSGFTKISHHNISDIFPMGSHQPYGYFNAYQSRVDVAYSPVGTTDVYILAGLHIWKREATSDTNTSQMLFKMQYRGTQNNPDNLNLWNYVCDPFICK